MRARWTPPEPPAPVEPQRPVWRQLPNVAIWTNDAGAYVVTGAPPAEEFGADGNHTHSCDAMGCGSVGDHILARLDGSELTVWLTAGDDGLGRMRARRRIARGAP